jgi:hypothetical protein
LGFKPHPPKSKKKAKTFNETLRWRSFKRDPAASTPLLRRTLRLKLVATRRTPAKTGKRLSPTGGGIFIDKFNINQHKMRKSEVPEGVLKKPVFSIRNQCEKVTFQEA